MEYIKKIKELLKDPKKKSLTQLGLYAIFFIFVIVLIRGGDSVSTPLQVEKENSIETYNSMKGYNYKIIYTTIYNTDIIEGTYYDNKSIFTYNNIKYYFEDFLYIIDNDSYYLGNINYNISKIFSNNLYTIFDNLEEESKTTYKDGYIVTNYKIDSNILYNYLYEVESNYSNYVIVSIKQQDNVITNITLDLYNLGLELSKIDIEYSDINNIEGLYFNKENYIYKENIW